MQHALSEPLEESIIKSFNVSLFNICNNLPIPIEIAFSLMNAHTHTCTFSAIYITEIGG